MRAFLNCINSKQDRAGHCAYAFRFTEAATGKQVVGTISGGESNIHGIVFQLNGGKWDTPDSARIDFDTQEMGIRAFDRMVKGWPYAGCTSQELAAFILKELKPEDPQSSSHTPEYEAMVAERIKTYNTTREVVERAAKAFWTSNETDDPKAYADSREVKAAIPGDSHSLDQFLAYFANQAKPKTFTHCPECGEPLEATAKIYLKNVEVDADGFLVHAQLAFGETTTYEGGTGWREAINDDEPEELEIYCANDHVFSVHAGDPSEPGHPDNPRTM